MSRPRAAQSASRGTPFATLMVARSAAILVPICFGLITGCGYSTRPGLASNLHTVYVKPFTNKIDIAQVDTAQDRFPIYRHRLEVDLTNEVVNRYQFTGLLRPAGPERADALLEGELVSYRRDALRYNASQQVEEWRINLVVNLQFYDQKSQLLLWDETSFVGDATYFELGPNAESESTALERAIRDLARRIVERSVENW